jgi:hypothetical protein
MPERYSRAQKDPPSQPTSGPTKALGYGCYVAIGLVLLALVVVLLALCVPHGSSI